MGKRLSVVCGGIALFFILLFSCKIGLGASIDTTPPTIEILQPKASAVIREDFCLKGKWTDDGYIKNIIVTLSSTDTDAPPLEFSANVNTTDSTWSCVINPLDSKKPIPDGTYEATIAITDTYEHVTSVSRTFTIDNTPPVLILQRPSTIVSIDKSNPSNFQYIKPSNYDTYGKVLTLDGQGADDNDIDLLEMKVYSAEDCNDASYLYIISKKNIPPTISLDLAKNDPSNPADELYKAYSSIYGIGTTSKSVYCKIYSYDSAQRYPSDGSAQTDEDKKGNRAEHFYLYSEISKDPNLESYKVPELYKMLNGTSSETKSIIDTVKTSLKNNEVEIGCFTLNPKNNPTYTVNGRGGLNENIDNFTNNISNAIYPETKIVIDVSPGLDNFSLDGNSIYPYFIECDNFGKEKAGAKKIYPDKNNVEITPSGSSYKVIVKINGDQTYSNKENTGSSDRISSLNTYLIKVEGQDIKGNEITPDSKEYGFKYTPSGAAPVLNIGACINPDETLSSTEFDKQYIQNEVMFNIARYKDYLAIAGGPTLENSIFSLKGTYRVEDGDKPTTIAIKMPSKDTITEATINPTVIARDTNSNPIEWSFRYDIPTGDFPNPEIEGQKSVTVEISQENMRTSVTYTLTYDIKAPSIKINTVEPFAYKYNVDGSKETVTNSSEYKKYLNGKNVSANVMLSDSKTGVMLTSEEKPKLEFIQNGVVKETIYFDDESGQVLENIDTTKCDQGEVILRVTARDYAGNEAREEKTFYIDQTTDEPVILPKNTTYNSVDLTEAELNATDNTKNIFSAGQTLSLRLIDDDALKSANIKVFDSIGQDVTDKGEIQINGETEIAADYIMPENADTYKVIVTVTDLYNITTTKTFYTRVTASAPKVDVELDNSYVTTRTASDTNILNPRNTLEATLAIDSNQGPFTIERYIKKNTDDLTQATDEYYKTTFTNIASITYVDTIDFTQGSSLISKDALASGSYKVFYKVTDKNGKVGQKTININVDNTIPVASITSSVPNKADSTFIFKGKVTENGSGVGKIQVSFDKVNIKDVSPSTNWYYDCDFTTEGLSEGDNKFYVRAIDEVGNVSEWVEQQFVYDQAIPVLTDTSTVSNFVNSDFILTGTAFDSYGLQKLIVSDGAFTKDITLPASGTTAWNVDIEVGSGTGKLTEGSHSLVITAEDLSGKKVTVTHPITVDLTAPTVEITSYPNVSETESVSFIFSGTASDKSGGAGVSKVYIGFAERSPTATDWTGFEEVIGTNVWNKTINTTTNFTTTWTTEGDKTVYVYAVDGIGNISTVATQSFKYDKGKPVVNSIKYTPDGGSATDVTANSFSIKDLFTLSGSAIDAGGISSVVITESKDGGLPESVTVNGTDSWTTALLPLGIHRSNGNPVSGNYVYTIRAYDNVNKVSSEVKIDVSIDIDPPYRLTITSPGENKYIGNNAISDTSFSFSGQASDANTGVTTLYYIFTKSGTAPADISTYAQMSVSNGSWSFDKTIEGGIKTSTEIKTENLFEGTWYLHVLVEDGAGNITSPVTRKFDIDNGAPVLIDTSSIGNYVNADFTLTGTVSDTNGIESLRVYDGSFSQNITLPASGSNSWTTTIEVGNVTGKLSEGNHNLVIEAKDNSGKVTTVTRAVTVDITKPTLGDITIPEGSDFDSISQMFRGTALDSAGSGVAKVEVQFGKTIIQNDQNNIVTPVYTASGTTSWSYELKIPNITTNTLFDNEGTKYIYVKVTDNAGNVSDYKVEEFLFDTGNPVISNFEFNDGNSDNPIAEGSSEYIGNGTFTLKGEFADSCSNVTVIVNRGSQAQTVTLNPANSTTGTWSVSQTGLSDGIYKYNISAKDASGRMSDTSSVTLRVDTSAPTVDSITCPDINQTEGNTITFSGTASDNTNGSGVDKVYLGFKARSLTAKNWNDYKETYGTTIWNYTVRTDTEFTAQWATEGEKTVYIYAVDAVGNISNYSTQTFIYDKSKPVISNVRYTQEGETIEDVVNNNFKASKLFTLSGTAFDGYEVDSVSITESKDGGADNPIGVTGKTSWVSDQLPSAGNRDGSKPVSGTYVYKITATDKVGKVSEIAKITVVIDIIPPTVSITSPSGTVSGDRSLSGTDYTFRGNVGDTGTSGIKAYNYVISTDSTPPAYDSSDWENTLVNTDGPWTQTIDLKTGTTFSSGKLCEGHYYIYVWSEDNAGNKSGIESKEFYVDMNLPEIKNVAFQDGTNTPVSVEENKINYFSSTNSTVTLLGKVEDTYGIEKLTVNGNEITVGADGSWSESITVTTDNEIRNEVIVTDKSGKQTKKIYTLYCDTDAPTAEITNPSDNIDGKDSLSGSKYTFRFSVDDGGSGVKLFGYLLTDTEFVAAGGKSLEEVIKDSATAPDAEANHWVINRNGGYGANKTLNLVAGKTPASPAIDTVYEGEHFVYLYCEDNGGNYAVDSKYYWVDKASPVLAETKVGKAGKTLKKNEQIEFEGTVSDINTIKSLVIYDDLSLNNWPITLSGTCETSTQWKQNQPISVGTGTDQLCDGEHILSITAIDGSGKETTVERQIVVDTESPISSGIEIVSTPDWLDSSSNKWFKNGTVKIKVKGVEDIDKNSYNSGISTVQYTTDSGANPSWIPMTKESGTNDWTANIYCMEQGPNTIRFQVIDVAGNTQSASLSTIVYIDNEKPATPTTYKVDGVDDLIGNKLINGRKTVSMNVSVADGLKTGLTDYATTTGISKIIYKGVTDYEYTCTDAGPYSFTIPLDKLKTGNVKFEIYDKVGNFSEWTPFNFVLDKTAPTIKMVSPSDADSISEGVQVNGSISFEGTARDSGGSEVSSIDLCYYIDAARGWKNLTHLTGEGLSSWSVTNIDTTSAFGANLAPGTEVILCAIVTDTAGNRNLDTTSGSDVTDNTVLETGSTTNRIPTIAPSAITNDVTNGKVNKISIRVDQDTDRPIIKFSTVDLAGDADGIIWLKNQTKIVGSISDDDGIDTSSFKIALSDSNTDSDWKEITVDGTSWSFDIADFFTGTDEEKEKAANKLINLYFKVKDVNGREFKSKAENSTCNETLSSTIKMQSGTATVTTKGLLNADKTTTATSTILPLTIDTLPPTVEVVGGRLNTEDEYSSAVSSLKYGGTKTNFYLKVKAGDGLNQLKATNGVTGTATFKLSSENVVVNATVVPSENNEYILTFTPTDNQLTKIRNANFNDIAEIKVVAEDKAGNKSNQTANLNTDFKNPVITLSDPDSSQTLSGSVMAYGSIDSTATMFYALSLDDTTTPGEDEEHKGSAITGWTDGDGILHANTINLQPYYKPIVGNSFQWFIYFDGKNPEENKTHDILLKDYLTAYEITTVDDINNKVFKDIVKFNLWIKATDESGNQTVEKYVLYVDPQGDAPKVTIDYPKDDGSVLGGNVTLRGAATDTIGSNIGVENVWVQIISAKENGYISSNADQLNVTKGGLTFSDKVTQAGTAYSHTYTIENFVPKGKDVKQWIANGYEVYTNIGSANPTKVTTGSAPADTAAADNYYIMASVSGSAWNLTINGNKEFDPAEGNLNLVVYRVFAQDKDLNLSRYQEQFGIFDSDTPVYSNVYLRQYSNNESGTGTVVASRPYEADMWVKGKWWIYGSVQDTQGIKSLKINGVTQTGLNGGGGVVETFNYPLTTDTGVGSCTIQIEAEDKADPSHTGVFSGTVNYDNQEPELVTSGTTYKINPAIQNSNGFYMFSSQVTEDAINAKAQSGFDYLAFWFERNNGSKHVIYDVMRKQTDREIAWADVSASEGLMWKTKTVTRTSSSLGVLTLAAEDSNIHVGGLCKIGGSVYKITSVSGTVIAINGQPEMPASGTSQTAYFAMANVVDNSIESASGEKSYVDGLYGYYSTISNDDGDHMVESVQKSGTTWTWEANINSQNIPDGSIVLHYVAFDKAGNYKTGSLDANIANNAPRLASVKVWTDFNEDNIEDEGESDTKFCSRKTRTIGGSTKYVATDVTSKLIVSGNDKDFDSSIAGTSFMNITAATKFIPEIIGGNGDLYYSRKIGTSANIASASTTYGETSFGKGHDDGIDEEADGLGYKILDDEGSDYVLGHTGYIKNSGDTEETLYALEVTNSELETLNNGLTWFNYVIYDSTEGCSTWNKTASGTTGRLSAEFHVALNVLYKDEAGPTVNFIPLYWKSSTDNSVYMDVNGNKYGHVELKGDLGSSQLGTTYGTDDDKVSGIVVFRGTAYDNKKLKKLEFKIMPSSGSTALLTGSKAVTYDSGTWSTSATMNTDHYTFNIISAPDTSKGITKDDVFFNGNGHQVIWELSVDTSYITGIVAKDTKVVVTATDYSSSTGMTGYNNYKVDILPYITGIKSRLDNPRSSNGRYQIADDEKTTGSVMLQGYNLTQGNGPVDISSIMGTRASGDYSYTVPGSSIATINNINNNNAHGEYDITVEGLSRAKKAENMYNYQATSINASLTDDVAFDMWQFNNRAALTNTGYGFIQKPIMKYNPSNGKLGFAFSNGPNLFSMANGTSTSYTFWEKNYASYVANAFTFDQSGRSHGISVGIDTSPSSGKAGRMNYFYSGWGISDTGNADGNFYFKNNIHLDCIGVPNPNDYTSSSALNGKWENAVIMEERFKGTTIVAADHPNPNNATQIVPTVYVAYYDNICNRIVFRYGTIDKKQTSSSYKDEWGTKSAPNDMISCDQFVSTTNSKEAFAIQAKDYSLIAGYDAGGTKLTPYEPGEYVCLTVIPGSKKEDDVVCIVWYDAINKNLMYSYKKNPCTDNDASTTTGNGYWSTATVLKENCGEYCKIVADGNGGIHIAAYDRSEKGIAYVYLPAYDSAYSEENNLFYIDTFNGPFDEIYIDVAVDKVGAGGKAYPSISYYANGVPKLATYSKGISSMPEAAIDENSFTGNWDVCFVPTPSTLLKDHINVAMPKDKTGKLGYKETSSSFGSVGGKNDGTVTGNKTNNPVLGYAIREGANGYMEIAQRK